MTSMTPELTPAAQLARAEPLKFPNEGADYRAQRTALLAEEIELRRHIERVAARCPPAEWFAGTTASRARRA